MLTMLAATVLGATLLLSQPISLHVFAKAGKYGFVDDDGVLRIPAQFDRATEERLTHGCNVIPVLLPDSPAHVRPPMQLAGLTWVDFRKPDRDPVAELVRGICTSPLRA